MRGIALAVGLLALSGCSVLPYEGPEARDPVRVCEPAFASPPCGSGAAEGMRYRFDLMTHCGIEWAYFDGRYWVPRRPVDPPSDWAAVTGGTMTLTERDRAVFDGPSGPDVHFVPAPDAYEPPTCA